MIFRFPDQSTFIHAIGEEIIPSSIAERGVWGGIAEDDSVWVDVSRTLHTKVIRQCLALNVEIDPRDRPPRMSAYRDWYELLPLQPTQSDLIGSPPHEALFICSDPREMVELSAELWRLGSRRQSMTWSHDVGWLRSAEPAWHALHHRARAFLPARSDVWIEYGFTHPFVARLTPTEGKAILLTRDERHHWKLADFPPPLTRRTWSLPSTSIHVHDRRTNRPVNVTLRLQVGSTRESERWWVLPADGLAELRRFLEVAEERIISRLDIAFLQEHEETRIVLRAHSDRAQAPVLVMNALGLVPYLKLDELMVPAGTQIRPSIRRELLRGKLAPNSRRITWLQPSENGRFETQSMPGDCLKPLDEWVEYVVEQTPISHQSWRPSEHFLLESFTCPADVGIRSPRKRRRGQKSETEESLPANPELPYPVVSKSGTKFLDEEPDDVSVSQPVVDGTSQEAERRLAELEHDYRALHVEPEAPIRRRLWTEMSRLHFALGNDREGALCALSAMWSEPSLHPERAKAWLRAETGGEEVDLEELITKPRLAIGDLRVLVAVLLGYPDSVLTSENGYLEEIGRILSREEERLPVRAAWLGWVAISRLAGGDILGLTRARDRLLKRLHDVGLNATRDLPSVLRAQPVTKNTSDRFDIDRFRDLHRRATRWLLTEERPQYQIPPTAYEFTHTYADLIFAFGMARFGDGDSARAILGEVGAPPRERVHLPEEHWLWAAYFERVEQELRGQRGVPFSDKLAHLLERLPSDSRTAVDRLRQHSRILEPHDRTDPYRFQRDYRRDPFGKKLADLSRFTDPVHYAERVEELFAEIRVPRTRLRLLAASLPRAFQVGERFAVEMLGRVGPVFESLSLIHLDLAQLQIAVHLLETALALAGHFDRGSFLAPLQTRLEQFLGALPDVRVSGPIGALSGTFFRMLSRLGLRDKSKWLCETITKSILRGRTVDQLMKSRGINRATAFPALLRLAGGWFYFGSQKRAEQVLEWVRAEVYDTRLGPVLRTDLACSYADALGQAPSEISLPLIEELFDRLSVPPLFSNKCYLLNKLRVIESVVLALAAEDFSLDSEVRRRLDEEEFLIRRRIHRDVREAVHSAGL